MGKTLFICEKPSVGRDLAGALGESFKRADSHLESESYVVSWAIGHLLRLYNPDEYDERWKRWRLEDLPLRPAEFQLRPENKTRKQLTSLGKLIRRDDVELVVNACDAGREGELIFRYIWQYTKGKKPTRRLWLASLTQESIRKGLAEMREGAAFDQLADAARSRAEADWLVGMNGSRAATLVLRDVLGGTASVGRVQTPTLALLVRREQEIRAFRPEDYWVVQATFVDEKLSYVGSYQDARRLGSQEEAERIQVAVAGQPGTITGLERSAQQVKPPQLYDLTSLQREASSAWGWTAARTLSLAQALYEQHKAITYPRTDSRWLTSDQAGELPGLLRSLLEVEAYQPALELMRSGGPLPLGQVVNDAKVKDHYAILPTGKRPSTMSAEESKLLDMVSRRLIAALLPPAELERTRIETTTAGHLFVSKGKIVRTPGWRKVYEGVGWFKQDEHELPAVEQGQQVTTEEAEVLAKQTQPPKRYTDATLLGAMETAGKLVEDEEARDAMKESGLGTPATRASIIERLVKMQYLRREKKALVPTDKGMQLVETLEGHPLISPDMTGEWERRLSEVEAGKQSRAQFMGELDRFTAHAVEQIVQLRAKVAHLAPPDERPSLGECPGCGKPVREGPRSWSCWTRSDPGCGFAIWKTVAGRELDGELAGRLLRERRLPQLEGFRSKAGKPFRAGLHLVQEPERGWRVSFVFDDPPAPKPPGPAGP